jgi:hypothetical protein
MGARRLPVSGTGNFIAAMVFLAAAGFFLGTNRLVPGFIVFALFLAEAVVGLYRFRRALERRGDPTVGGDRRR